jgi:hypothetical protein
MLDQGNNNLIMDDQQQRSLDRRGAGRPIEHLICPDIPDELTFLEPELVDLLTIGSAAFSARIGSRAACGLPDDCGPATAGFVNAANG